MNFFSRYKNIIGVVLLVGVAFVGYSIFFTSEDTGTLAVSQVDPGQAAVEQELIALLLQLRSIRLDLALFDDAEFKSLTDFSQSLVPEPSGRVNPFAPLE